MWWTGPEGDSPFTTESASALVNDPVPAYTGAMTDDADRTMGDGRHETLNQRMDRNWNELLQEFRVTQAGTQILTGFLLAIAFQSRFADLDQFQLVVYVVLMILAIVTSLLALVPVSLHRSVFRQQLKPALVTASHHIMRLVLAGIALLMTGTILFVLDWTVSRLAGAIAGGLVFVGVVIVVVLPGQLWLRDRGSSQSENSSSDQEVHDQA